MKAYLPISCLYLCGGDVAFSVGMTTVSTLVSPVSDTSYGIISARGTQITIKGLQLFVSIIETVILVGFDFTELSVWC